MLLSCCHLFSGNLTQAGTTRKLCNWLFSPRTHGTGQWDKLLLKGSLWMQCRRETKTTLLHQRQRQECPPGHAIWRYWTGLAYLVFLACYSWCYKSCKENRGRQRFTKCILQWRGNFGLWRVRECLPFFAGGTRRAGRKLSLPWCWTSWILKSKRTTAQS